MNSKKTLSDKEKAILSVIQLDASLSNAEIAKRTGLWEHIVAYHIKYLQESRIIHPTVFVNIHKLGLSEYSVYFSIMGSKAEKEALMKALGRSPSVAWFAETAGTYQLACTISAKTAAPIT